jgi:hypothetical protein
LAELIGAVRSELRRAGEEQGIGMRIGRGKSGNAVALPSRFPECSRRQAALLLAIVVGAIVACQWVAWTYPTVPEYETKASRQTDVELYRRVIDRVRDGENYYDAVHEEFFRRDYPVCSLFNYRTPFYAWLFGALPDMEWGRAAQLTLAGAVLVLCYAVFWRAGTPILGAFAVVVASGALAWSFLDAMCLFTEVWAGALITMSVAAYGLGHRGVGVAAGLMALLFRELALPYCVIALGLAAWEGRRREAAAWLAGMALYALFFAWHASQVMPRLPQAVDGAGLGKWMQFGGLKFLLATTRTHLLILLAPAWVVALCLPLGVLGLAGWRHDMGRHSLVVVAVYLSLFAVVGALENFYWGLLYTPLLAIGVALAPRALLDLIRVAQGATIRFQAEPRCTNDGRIDPDIHRGGLVERTSANHA